MILRYAYLILLIVSCSIHYSDAQSGVPSLVLQGRFSPGGQQANATVPQLISWPASSIYAAFEGSTSVYINITALPQNGSITYGMNWFRFFIDGGFAADAFTSYNELNIFLTLNVTTAAHTLRIAKMNDGSKGEAILQGINISPGARFLQPALPPAIASNKRILFIGDSYSVGYGNAAEQIENVNGLHLRLNASSLLIDFDILKVFNQNSLQAFTAVTADALGADYQVVATSGSGMVGYSFAASAHPQLPPAEYQAILPSNEALFNRSVYADSASRYDLQSWTPQVVVVSSGTNDWHTVPPLYTLSQWLSQAVGFLKQISNTYSQPTIIIQAWPPEQQIAGALNGADGLNETIQYMQAMPSLYTEAVRQGIPNIHYLQLDTSNYDNYYAWCDGHPSAVADKAIAQQLASFVGVVQPEWGKPAPVDITVDQVAIRPNTNQYSTTSSYGPPVSSAG